MANLSERLQTIANLVIAGEPAADIGSDHAFLPIFLVQNEIIPWAVAGELGDGPFERARLALEQSSLQDKIDLRQGDGLQVLALSEVSTVILAGLGGETIAAILNYDWEKSNSFRRYILQPMSRAGFLRHTLAKQGWPILDEKLLVENHHYYPIIISEPGYETYELDDLEAEIGPKILNANDSIKRGFIKTYVEKYGRVYLNLKCSEQSENRVMAQTIFDRKRRLEVILNEGHS